MDPYEEIVEKYNFIVDKLFSDEEITDHEAVMMSRFFSGSGTFPDIPDKEREIMGSITGENARREIKEMIKKTIERSGRIRKNLEGWE